MAHRDQQTSDDFESASRQPALPFWREFLSFLRHNKKWWLAPIVIGLSLLGLVAALSSTGLAPFVYTLF
jgi:hypothetical protein